MAEIKIEKKKTIWPWVLLGLIIVALAAYFLFFKDKNNDVVALTGPTDYTTAMQTPPDSTGDSVTEYVAFIDKDTANMSEGHEYSREALTKLVNATEQIANKQNVNISKDINEVRSLASKITENETSTTHADDIKKAAKIIGNALLSIQQVKFPDLKSEVDDVISDAGAIDVKELTLNQKGTVKDFFESAADLIKEMNN